MFIPRPYQEQISEKAYKILNTKGIVVLSCEVRTGKTFMSLMTCQKAKAKHVLFITKKKAISSILSDYKALNPNYSIEVINFESVHKIESKHFDIVVVDESHSLGAFPKPSKRTKAIKELIGNKRLILMSGTLTPESWSQIYHQFWISDNTPFTERNFYAWAKVYVNVKKTYVAHGNAVNNYQDANIKLIKQRIDPLVISYTKKEAGFTSQVDEQILSVKMKPYTYKLIDTIKKDKVFEGKNGGVILADTPVKEMQKVHQLFSGTIKLEDGSSKTVDNSKAEFIKQKFVGYKIAIFYVFKQELEMLKQTFGDNLTTSLDEFNITNKNIALQVVSGREGISLKNADFLVMFNIQFSATSYWQSRDRMTTLDREKNKVFWVFAENGLEHYIYTTVLNKRSYTIKHYKSTLTESKI